MKFILEINLGNEAMQTSEDVAELLYRTWQELYWEEGDEPTDSGVRDINGNTVGAYRVEK